MNKKKRTNRSFQPRGFRYYTILVGLLWVGTVCACSVPVFRYALERWPADTYRCVIFHAGPLGNDHQETIAQLETFANANGPYPSLLIRALDTAQEIPQAYASLWNQFQDRKLPLVVMLSPLMGNHTPVVWSAPLSDATVQRIMDSPTRRELVRRLASGDTAVWLLLQSGDPAQDQSLQESLTTHLREMESELKLPHQLDPRDTTYDQPMNEAIALKIAFSILPLNLTDPGEALLASVFRTSVEKDLEETLPAVVPVYGRGRALTILDANSVYEQSIADIGHFLVGPCSCEIKQANPGLDLPLFADWDGLITGMIDVNEALPPLTVPILASAVEPNQINQETPPSSSSANPLQQNLVGLGVFGLVIVGLGTFLVVRKQA